MRTHTSAVHRPPFTRASPRVRVVVADGPDRGEAIVLTDDLAVRVGTAADSTLVLTDPSVSRHHAELRWADGMLAVVDRSSKNGTFAGTLRLREALVPAGTELRVGTTLLHVVPDDEALEPAESATTQHGELVGASRVMRQLFTLIDQIATTSVPILIDGETGTGKHAVAREIHARSQRPTLTTLDCADPDRDLDVAFAEADTGTLVLDDIGALPGELQPALLRLLDRKAVRPSQRTVDVRVIAIARNDLAERLLAGTLRDDLYYRLAVIHIALLPLRDRREDIAALAQHFSTAPVDAATLTQLAGLDWPGNVRELRNAIETGTFATPSTTSARPSLRPFRDAKAELVDGFERRYLEDLMAHYTSLHAAADAAGMDRKHLRTLLRHHGLRRDLG